MAWTCGKSDLLSFILNSSVWGVGSNARDFVKSGLHSLGISDGCWYMLAIDRRQLKRAVSLMYR